MYFYRLKEYREKRGLSQKDIGEYLGIQQTVYSRYERGFQTIPLEHLLSLAELYGTSADFLLEKTNIERPYPKSLKK